MEALYRKLKKAWSERNLNRVTGKLIALYKARDFGGIRFLANRISGYVRIEEENDARCFSKLIMLYHPDKGSSIREKLDRHYRDGDRGALEAYSHILLLDETIPEPAVDVDIDYQPEYVWDTPGNENIYLDDDENEDDTEDVLEFDGTFYNAVKLRVYGNLAMEFPPYYLEDWDEIEMADSGIEVLEGIEYCRQTVRLDLSGNRLNDISGLWYLDRLEELFLSDNQIGYIDVIGNLLKLRVLDLSGNEIDDISPLMRLENLEYVNLIGNRIPQTQIRELAEKGVIVTH